MELDHPDIGTCSICGFRATSETNMKDHKRNDHLSKTDSMSPPHKKIRDDEHIYEIHKVDTSTDTEIVKVINTLSFEEVRLKDRYMEKKQLNEEKKSHEIQWGK